jgi:hypothetical protein
VPFVERSLSEKEDFSMRVAILFAAMLALSACGGGDGDKTGVVQPDPAQTVVVPDQSPTVIVPQGATVICPNGSTAVYSDGVYRC